MHDLSPGGFQRILAPRMLFSGHQQAMPRCTDHRHIRGRTQGSVQNYPQRLAHPVAARLIVVSRATVIVRQGPLRRPHRIGRPVRQHRPHPGDHRRTACPQALHIFPRRRAGDPLGLAAGHGRAAIHTGSNLDTNIRPLPGHPGNKPRVQVPGLGFQQSRRHRNAGIRQPLQSLPRYLRIRVFHGRDNPGHPGFHQRIGARTSPTGMGARLQGDIGRGSLSPIASRRQRMALGMELTGPGMEALAHHRATTHQHTAHPWIRVRGVQAMARQLQRPAHKLMVGGRKAHDSFGSSSLSPGLPPAFFRRSTSAENSEISWKLRYTDAKRT